MLLIIAAAAMTTFVAIPAEASHGTQSRLDALNAIHELSRETWSGYYDYLRRDPDLAWMDWSQDSCSAPGQPASSRRLRTGR